MKVCDANVTGKSDLGKRQIDLDLQVKPIAKIRVVISRWLDLLEGELFMVLWNVVDAPRIHKKQRIMPMHVCRIFMEISMKSPLFPSNLSTRERFFRLPLSDILYCRYSPEVLYFTSWLLKFYSVPPRLRELTGRTCSCVLRLQARFIWASLWTFKDQWTDHFIGICTEGGREEKTRALKRILC